MGMREAEPCKHMRFQWKPTELVDYDPHRASRIMQRSQATYVLSCRSR